MSKELIEKQLKEAKEELATLKKMGASADEIEFAEDEVKELEEKLKSSSESKKAEPNKKGAVSVRSSSAPVKKPMVKRVEKPTVRKIEKAPVKKQEPTKVSGNKRGRKPLSKEEKALRKSKGLSVVYDGKTYMDTDPDFCKILVKQLEERQKKRREASKAKPTSLSTKVGGNIADAVVTSIKGAFKENKNQILENKTSANRFLKVIDKIETASERFIKELKIILSDDFKQKDFDRELKDVEEVVKKIKDTIHKSLK